MARHDEEHMREALDLALRGWGRVSPNPLVGALLVRGPDVLGRGWYVGPRGSPHGEIRALEEAGGGARGSTLVCTLEPCAHLGSTPPCTEAIIAAGVRRVVVGAKDPNPIVDGRGIERLRAAGIEVETGVLGHEVRLMNEAFEKHVTTGTPFVTLKMAASLDGTTAATDGSSRWITGERSRADVQRLRAGADALVVGVGTAIADDPSLTVRDPAYRDARPPLRIVMDPLGRLEAGGKLFDGSAPTLIATTEQAPRERVRAWQDTGADVLELDPDPDGRVGVRPLLDVLGKRDLQSVLVEGGPTLAWSFVRDGAVDTIVLYIAPILVGGANAPGVLGGAGFAPLAAAHRVKLASVERLGDDLKVVARVHRDR